MIAKVLGWVSSLFVLLLSALKQLKDSICSKFRQLLRRVYRSLVPYPCPDCSPPEIADQREPSQDERNALLMAFASYFATEWIGGREHIEQKTQTTLREFLQRSDVAQLVAPAEQNPPTYELCWGPACYQASVSHVADNTMFVARPSDGKPKLYIGIAGTHPLSIFSWLFNDLDVYALVEWPYALRTEHFFEILGKNAAEGTAKAETADTKQQQHQAETNTKLMIAKGTFLGLKTLVGMTDPTTKKTLLNFLKDQCESYFCNTSGAGSQAKLDIVITGHSLGGALCHALALYLHDNVSVWDTHGVARVSCVSFAGPTIGNKLLARYYDACLGSRTRRIANVYDIVPLAWDRAYMPQMYRVYEPQLPTPPALRMMVQVLINTVGPKQYAHVRDDQKFFRGTPPCRSNDWVVEVMAQHSKSYFTHFGLNSLAPLIAEHAPLFREPFCDGTFSAASVRTFANMVSESVSLAVKRMSGKEE